MNPTFFEGSPQGELAPLNPFMQIPLSTTQLPAVEGFSLFVRNLLTWVPAQKRLFRAEIPQKEILKGITCAFPAGKMTAIVGPSGSGKTTLMNFLAGRQDESQKFRNYAEYYLNGHRVQDLNQFKNLIGYVLQEDLMESGLTPRQTFEFYARMRRKENPVQAAEEVIDQLELQKCPDTIIGDSFTRGISGGEKKRVNIGIELISDPNLLFLDEPTTGLDSLTALDVVQTLHRLRNRGMTVVTVIHSPSDDILALFDQVVVLCQGQLIYDGPPENIVERLARFGFAVPLYVSPLEQLMKLIDKDETKINMEKSQGSIAPEEIDRAHAALLKAFTDFQMRETCRHHAGPVAPDGVELAAVEQLSRSKNRPPSFFVQFFLLSKMLGYLFYSDVVGLLLKLVVFLILAAFYVLVYLNLGDRSTYLGVQSRAGVLFMLCTLFFMMGVNSVVAVFLERKRIYKKDKQKRMYWPSVFYLVNQLFQLPYFLLVTLLILIMVYFSLELNKASAAVFFWYLFFFFAGGYLGGSSLAIVISVVVNSMQEVGAVNPIIILPANVIAGFFAQVKNVLEPLRTISYLSPVRFMFQGTILAEFGDDFNDSFFNFYEGSKWRNAVAILGLVVGYRLAFYFFFLYSFRERRTRYAVNPELMQRCVPPALNGEAGVSYSTMDFPPHVQFASPQLPPF